MIAQKNAMPVVIVCSILLRYFFNNRSSGEISGGYDAVGCITNRLSGVTDYSNSVPTTDLLISHTVVICLHRTGETIA